MERLDLALEASNEVIWDWSFRTGTIDFTMRVEEFLGCAKEDVPNFFDDPSYVHEEDREEFAAAVEAVKSRKSQMLAVEPRLESADGQWKWFRLRGVPGDSQWGVDWDGGVHDRHFEEEAGGAGFAG